MYHKTMTMLLCLILFGLVQAKIINVPADQSTIQAGINTAVKGDTVLVADGTYYENISFKGKAITVASHFIMDSDTTHINNTIIDGSKPTDPNKGSVVSFVSREDTTSVICGFTITGGTGTFWSSTQRAGGGINCNNSGCKAVANKIINNSVTGSEAWGGGLYASPAGSSTYVVLRGNQIAHNTITANYYAARGGGVRLLNCNGILVNNLISYNFVVNNATATNYQASSGGLECGSDTTDRRSLIVEFNRITHNSVISKSNMAGVSACCGGVAIGGSYGRFANNEVNYNELWANSDKTAGGAGILINWSPDSLIIEGNIIRNNSVKRGWGLGGGFLIGAHSSPKVINNIIEGNSASVGGGFLIARSIVQLVNNTVINNKATNGGGINVRMSSTVYLMNTIVWGNQASTYAGIQLEEGTVKAAYCDIQGGWSGVGNRDDDPLFADDSYQLASGSPCIGAGSVTHDFGGGMVCTCPSTDCNGNPRPNPVDAYVDIGAIESAYSKTDVDVQEKTEQVPTHFVLGQNYPNPFNPSTTIEFTLPKAAFVILTVYNLRGEQVATLIAEQRQAGVHQFNWDAGGLASGVYLYRLETEGFVQSRKLVLMR